jgi:hypothetical protein
MFTTVEPSAYFPHFLRKMRHGIIAFVSNVRWCGAVKMVWFDAV